MRSINEGDNGLWHCFSLRNFPDDAKKMEDKKLLQGSLLAWRKWKSAATSLNGESNS